MGFFGVFLIAPPSLQICLKNQYLLWVQLDPLIPLVHLLHEDQELHYHPEVMNESRKQVRKMYLSQKTITK